MRTFLWLLLTIIIVGCATPLPAEVTPARMPSPMPDLLQPENIRKVGPGLRQYLLQRSREVVEAPESLDRQLRPVTVVIQARRDISDELVVRSAKVRSITQNGIVVITADVPLEAIPSLLALPDLETIELAQSVSPAQQDGG